MFRDDKFFTLLKYWKKYKPEEELFMRLKDNPAWPFKSIGEGYYYISFRSDRIQYGIGILVLTLIFMLITIICIGPFSMAFATFSIAFLFGAWTLHGKIAWRELIVSRRGKGRYILRVFQNEEILFQNEIRNVYVRLVRKIDSMGDSYFCLVLGGFQLDDHRMTRMTKAQGALRMMGIRIATTVGINFFDWKDESEEHLIWHYKTYSKLHYKPPEPHKSSSAQGHPSRTGSDEETDPGRKVRISRVVTVNKLADKKVK